MSSEHDDVDLDEPGQPMSLEEAPLCPGGCSTMERRRQRFPKRDEIRRYRRGRSGAERIEVWRCRVCKFERPVHEHPSAS
jgi:hypothetical protein